MCRVCLDLPMKDGLSSVAWSKLMERHSIEKDNKVLEAYKISQVSMHIVPIILHMYVHNLFPYNYSSNMNCLL